MNGMSPSIDPGDWRARTSTTRRRRSLLRLSARGRGNGGCLALAATGKQPGWVSETLRYFIGAGQAARARTRWFLYSGSGGRRVQRRTRLLLALRSLACGVAFVFWLRLLVPERLMLTVFVQFLASAVFCPSCF